MSSNRESCRALAIARPRHLKRSIVLLPAAHTDKLTPTLHCRGNSTGQQRIRTVWRSQEAWLYLWRLWGAWARETGLAAPAHMSRAHSSRPQQTAPAALPQRQQPSCRPSLRTLPGGSCLQAMELISIAGCPVTNPDNCGAPVRPQAGAAALVL
jgi:hypothetical protein